MLNLKNVSFTLLLWEYVEMTSPKKPHKKSKKQYSKSVGSGNKIENTPKFLWLMMMMMIMDF